jgi:hypothetical protein
MNMKAQTQSETGSSSTSMGRCTSAKSLHSKTPSRRFVEEISPSQKIAFLKEMESKFQRPSSSTTKSFKEKSLVFKQFTEAEKQEEQAKMERKHAVARNHKIKFEAGKVEENGRSEYSIIANPRPEADFKPCIVKFAQAPSQSRDEVIKKSKKSTPINMPTRCPITEGDEPRPVSARSWGMPSYKTHAQNSKKTFLPSDRDDGCKTTRNTTSYAREMYNKTTMNELPKKLIKSKTTITKNLGKDMKSLLEHHFAALN